MVATIKSLEHALGFKWKAHGGMHKATETPFPLIEQAIEELTEQLSDARVSNKHVIANVHELDVIDEHFDYIGPELWPDEGSDRNAWLVDANEENFGGLYPRNLYFSVPEDYDLLRERFQDLLLYKVGIRLYEQRRIEAPCEEQDSCAIDEGLTTNVTREDEGPSAPDQTSFSKPQDGFPPTIRSTLRKHILTAFLQPESSGAGELPPEVLVAIAAAVVDDKTTYKWRGTSYNVPEDMLGIGKEVIEQFSKAAGDQPQPAVSSAKARCEVIDLDLLSSDSDNEEEDMLEERTPSSPEILPSQHNRAMPGSLAEMRAFLLKINLEVQYCVRQDESPVVSLHGCYTSAKLFERIQASMPVSQVREVQAFVVYFQGVREIRVRKDHEPDFQKLVHRMICEDVHEGFVAIEW